MIVFLKQLVTFESPSNDPEAQISILLFLKEKLISIGFDASIYPGKETPSGRSTID